MGRKIIATGLALIILFLTSCQENKKSSGEQKAESNIELMVLGIAQDAGYPQINCEKSCCQRVISNPSLKKMPTSLALLNHEESSYYLFEASAEITAQINLIKKTYPNKNWELKGIFISHAHMGHYLGLAHLGREAMGAKSIPIYVFPRFKEFLETNGPWSQLVKLENIKINTLVEEQTVSIFNNAIKVTAFKVPHRDEFSETAGFSIAGEKRILFIPDIDKWERWDKNLKTELRQYDYAFIDATFAEASELPGRNMSEIPHPYMEETFKLIEHLEEKQKNKIHFIHFNHTNKFLNPENEHLIALKKMNLAKEGQVYPIK